MLSESSFFALYFRFTAGLLAWHACLLIVAAKDCDKHRLQARCFASCLNLKSSKFNGVLNYRNFSGGISCPLTVSRDAYRDILTFLSHLGHKSRSQPVCSTSFCPLHQPPKILPPSARASHPTDTIPQLSIPSHHLRTLPYILRLLRKKSSFLMPRRLQGALFSRRRSRF